MAFVCKRDHIGAERDARGNCRECARHRARAHYAANPDYRKEWLRKNAEKHRANVAAYRERHPERNREIDRKSKAANPRRVAHEAAMRRARIARATPSWTDIQAIRRIYENCPPGLEVDHVLPLAGRTVCGLHVPANLQYLTRSENARKNNRVEV